MKYILRAVKYFITISVLVTLILLALVLTHVVSSDINVMFVNGWKSVGYIAIMFAGVAAIYPLLGYKKLKANALGDYEELREGVVKCMEERGYVLGSENEQSMLFRARSTASRIFRLGEDRITLTKVLGGFEVEGLARDVARIVYALEFKLRDPDAENL